jgi:hypothetical protein
MKRLCRKVQIKKWPYRQLKGIMENIAQLEQASCVPHLSTDERKQIDVQISSLRKKHKKLISDPRSLTGNGQKAPPLPHPSVDLRSLGPPPQLLTETLLPFEQRKRLKTLSGSLPSFEQNLVSVGIQQGISGAATMLKVAHFTDMTSERLAAINFEAEAGIVVLKSQMVEGLNGSDPNIVRHYKHIQALLQQNEIQKQELVTMKKDQDSLTTFILQQECERNKGRGDIVSAAAKTPSAATVIKNHLLPVYTPGAAKNGTTHWDQDKATLDTASMPYQKQASVWVDKSQGACAPLLAGASHGTPHIVGSSSKCASDEAFPDLNKEQ